MTKSDVCIVGGGMITEVQILPTIYHLQRLGRVGDIHICALNSAPLKKLVESESLKKAFPGSSFTAHPSLDTDPEKMFPDISEKVIASLPQQSIVIVAVPDQVHYSIMQFAMKHNHHVICVKPLVQQHRQAVEIEKEAYQKGLVIGVEYHKRLDDRALMARQLYNNGKFGEFKVGHAEMNEPYYYRYSNFQNWFTCENSDMFTYVGCHYVDQVHFITGLMPTAVSVYGIKDKFPNGKEGYLFTDGRVFWENGACLHLTDVMGYPDDAPGGNYQGLRMYCSGADKCGMLFHDDQYRGVEHSYISKGNDPGDTYYAEPSPDYFKYVYLGGEGLTPVGYGYRSIKLIFDNIQKVLGKQLKQRQQLIEQFDREGVMATPKNSSYNELVVEAARLSINNGGKTVNINYGENPNVSL